MALYDQVLIVFWHNGQQTFPYNSIDGLCNFIGQKLVVPPQSIESFNINELYIETSADVKAIDVNSIKTFYYMVSGFKALNIIGEGSLFVLPPVHLMEKAGELIIGASCTLFKGQPFPNEITSMVNVRKIAIRSKPADIENSAICTLLSLNTTIPINAIIGHSALMQKVLTALAGNGSAFTQDAKLTFGASTTELYTREKKIIINLPVNDDDPNYAQHLRLADFHGIDLKKFENLEMRRNGVFLCQL